MKETPEELAQRLEEERKATAFEAMFARNWSQENREGVDREEDNYRRERGRDPSR